MKAKNKIIISLFLFLAITISLGLFLSYRYPTTSPFKSVYYFLLRLKNPHSKMKKETLGFLTYWRAEDEDLKSIRGDLLSQIVYFSLSVNQDGQIIRIVKGETDPGWLRWRSKKIRDLVAKTQIEGGKFSVAVAMQKNQIIESFLKNPKAQQKLVNEVKQEIKENRLDGVNLDFEYSGSPEAELRDRFTAFAENFSKELRKTFPKINLSIDVYPLAVRKQRLVDIPKVAPFFDRIIIMAYDFYAPNSDIAGPIAPISGFAEKKYIFDIKTAYADFVKYVKPGKLILGIPYYGYDWPIEEASESISKTLEQNEQNGYVEVLSYSRMRNNPKFNSPDNCKWDPFAQAPWCWYEDEKTGTSRQAWFENTKSIEAKFNFANDKKFAGIALWSLGYDRGYQDLWDMIKSKFTRS